MLVFSSNQNVIIMQKHIIQLSVISLLCGCAASPHQADNSAGYAQKKAQEKASWSALEKLSADKCGASPEPPERTQAVELSDCVTELVRQYVLPNAVFPDLLLSSRRDALLIAKDYADGKMTAEEYKRRSQKRLKNYSHALIYFANERMPSSIG